MTPEQLAKSGTESAHQIALFQWAALSVSRWPCLRWLHHIPNGGSRGDSGASRAIAGGRLKAEGVRSGVADVFLPVARCNKHGLYIEMKAPKFEPKRLESKGGLSDEQIEFGNFVMEQGYSFWVCYSWQQASTLIESYLKGEL